MLVSLFLFTMSVFTAVLCALVALNANFQLVTLQEPPQTDTEATLTNLITELKNSVNSLANTVTGGTNTQVNLALARVNTALNDLTVALNNAELSGKFNF